VPSPAVSHSVQMMAAAEDPAARPVVVGNFRRMRFGFEEVYMEKVRSADGTLIAYERSGTGSVLVLVHGTATDSRRWATVRPQLEERFTVYALDRRGRGQSGDSSAYSIEREYEDIAAVVRSIPQPVNLLGHSFGALCALEAALLVDNLHKLILYEPAVPLGRPLYPAGMRAGIQELIDSQDRNGALMLFYRDVVGIPESEIELMKKEAAWTARLEAAHTIPREFADEDYSLEPSRFAGLQIPVLLLQGEKSPDLLKAATEAVNAALPESRIVILPGQQHLAMSTAPDLFVRLVTEFLTDSD